MKKVSIVLFLLVSIGLSAQQSFLTLEWENDGYAPFSGQSDNDKWYTNGIRVKYGAPVLMAKNSVDEAKKKYGDIDLSKIENYDYVDIGGNLELRSEPLEDSFHLSDSLVGRFADNAFWMVFEAAQNMYTPTDISIAGPQYDDRPYAGWSRIGWSLHRQSATSMQRFGIDVGMLGEAGAGVTQTLIHDIVPVAQHPEAWETHVKDRFAFQAHFAEQRDYLCPKARWAGKKDYYWFSFSSSYEVQLGNVQIGALYKPLLRFGYFNGDSAMTSIISIPPIPRVMGDRSRSKAITEENGESAAPAKPEQSWFEAFVFLSPGIQAVVYDGTLDHQLDQGYDVTLVPLRLSFEMGAELDLVNIFWEDFPLKRIFVRYSPYYLETPGFAVDYYWPGSDFSVIPKNLNAIGRWYVGGSW